jgi:predicted lipoprotein with Yx(FWY)xxD motif
MRFSRRPISIIGLIAAALIAAAACASSSPAPADTVMGVQATPTPPAAPTGLALGRVDDPTLGAFLTGANGMTLYVFSKDTPDTSTCTGTCATTWPPLTVGSAAPVAGPSGASGAITIITRPDGTMQVAYDRRPLYYYSGDSAMGDANGQGKGGVWFVAALTGPATTVTPAAASQPPLTIPSGAIPKYGY